MKEYASRGIGNAALTTGIIGTALSVLNGGMGIGHAANVASCDHEVNRYEFDMQMGYEKQLREQQIEIASLNAEKISDKKDAEVYASLRGEMNKLEDKLSNRISVCEAGLSQQAIYNATNTSTISCIQNQVAQLQSLTKVVVPIANICPEPAVATATDTASA